MLCFGGRYELQRTLAIRIAAITLASDSAITLARFRPSKAQMCLCESKYQGGVSHHFGGVLISLKKCRAIWGVAAIVSQYRAIWGH